MPHRRYSRYKTRSKSMKKIISLKFIPKKTIITLYALRWVFFFIFLFLIAGSISVFLIDRIYTQMILTYSITGFFTFFTGYFGWIFARGVINTLSKNEDKLKNGNKLKKAISYHISEIDE